MTLFITARTDQQEREPRSDGLNTNCPKFYENSSGLSDVAEDGYRTYKRPEGKSGGHGVGWSEIPQYSFRVPDGWEETPVSIADLGKFPRKILNLASKPSRSCPSLSSTILSESLRKNRPSHVLPSLLLPPSSFFLSFYSPRWHRDRPPLRQQQAGHPIGGRGAHPSFP